MFPEIYSSTRTLILMLILATLAGGSVMETPVSKESDVFLFALERQLEPSSQFRLVAVSEAPIEPPPTLWLDNRSFHCNPIVSGGPPYAWEVAGVSPGSPGEHEGRLESRSGEVLAHGVIHVIDHGTRAERPAPESGVWQIERSWTSNWERLFSVWIAHLFRPLGDRTRGWKPLHQVLHNPSRNLLHNYLGQGEDDPTNNKHVRALADCGDTPYQLRAYFAWKLGLPFRFQRCDRGNSRTGPRCPDAVDNRTTKLDHVKDPVERFTRFLGRTISWHVHSGTTRTLPESQSSDFYPIPLSRNAIRPGTIFVDVGSHVLMVSQWNREGLYAIDGHPDKTVTRKRFSERFFPYARHLRTGGFKAFRSLAITNGELIPLSNNELGSSYSTEQYDLPSRQAFYSQMSGLIAQLTSARL